jgi:hypothetical protein
MRVGNRFTPMHHRWIRANQLSSWRLKTTSKADIQVKKRSGRLRKAYILRKKTVEILFYRYVIKMAIYIKYFYHVLKYFTEQK